MSRRHPEKKLRRSTITIPQHVGPHVKLVFSEMQRQSITYDEVEEKSGVLRSTVKAWRSKNAPGLTSLEAVFGVLNWDFVPVPRIKTLPAEFSSRLLALGADYGQPLNVSFACLVEAMAEARNRLPPPPRDLAPLRRARRSRAPHEDQMQMVLQ